MISDNLSGFFSRYRQFLVPLATLLIVVALSLTVGRALVNQLFEVRDNTGDLRERNERLRTKISTLSSINRTDLSADVDTALDAVPSNTSTLPALALIRNLAIEHGLSFVEMRVLEREVKKGARIVELHFDTEGGLLPTISFMNELRSSSPVLKLSSIRFSISGASSLTKFSAISFWGPLPKSLGDPERLVQTLTFSEEELLSELELLEKPEGAEVVISPPQGRDNPFAF